MGVIWRLGGGEKVTLTRNKHDAGCVLSCGDALNPGEYIVSISAPVPKLGVKIKILLKDKNNHEINTIRKILGNRDINHMFNYNFTVIPEQAPVTFEMTLKSVFGCVEVTSFLELKSEIVSTPTINIANSHNRVVACDPNSTSFQPKKQQNTKNDHKYINQIAPPDYSTLVPEGHAMHYPAPTAGAIYATTTFAVPPPDYNTITSKPWMPPSTIGTAQFQSNPPSYDEYFQQQSK